MLPEWYERLSSFIGFIVLPVQLSIQTTENLQNKVGRKNTPQQMWGKRNKKEKKMERQGKEDTRTGHKK